VTRQPQCPKCNADLPRKGRFCLECGLDLYDEGIHHPPSPWFPIIVVALILGGIVAFLATRPRQPKLPPEERQVRKLTTDLLALAAEGDYAAIVERYCRPDQRRYDKNSDLLRDVVRGSGAPGLNVFRATCMDNPEEAAKFVDRYEAPHPDYIAELLADITFEDGALRTSLGGTAFGAQRTDRFLAWFLERVFREADAANAQIVEADWATAADGESLMTVTVSYPEPVEAQPAVPSPTVIRWRRIDEGKWAVTLTDETNLQELLDLLRRAKL